MKKKFRKKLSKLKQSLLVRWDWIKAVFYFTTNQKMVRCYFSREKNFGDLFNYDLLNYFGYHLIYVNNPMKARLVMTGSLLQNIPAEFNGYILGAGFIREKSACLRNDWNIRIVRGPLSANQCGVNREEVIFGDPGILASVIFNSAIQKNKNLKKKYQLGIIPHYVDRNIIASLNLSEDVKIIDVRKSPKKVVKEILQCHNIASSSLHGLIFADSLRIPNVHVVLGDRLLGGLHKFKDYYFRNGL